jgi:protein-tyrosine phosphatase
VRLWEFSLDTIRPDYDPDLPAPYPYRCAEAALSPSFAVMSQWFRVYGFADVHERLLVGAYPLDGDDVSMLEWMKIDRILNLVEDKEYEPGEREAVRDALYAAGIEEHRLSLTDYGRLPAPQLEHAVAEVNEWLDQGHRVYVHCRAGWQRSAAIAAGVVALRERVGIEDALALVHRRKPSADPLPEQREDLLEWWAGRDHGPAGADTPDPSSATGDPAPDPSSATGDPAPDPSSATGDPAPDPSDEPGDAADDHVEQTDEVLRWLAENDPARRRKPAGGSAAPARPSPRDEGA